MLHILLLILKIIGIVLLCVLGILFLGIVCALFVPVRYRIEAVRKEGAGEPPVSVTVKITWLLHFVNVLACFAGSLSVRVRLTLFTLFRLPKPEKRGGKAKRTKTGEKQEKENRPQPDDTDPVGEAVPEPSESGVIGEKTREEPQKSGETGREEGIELSDSGVTGCKEETEPEKKPSLWDKLRAVPEILRRIFAKIKSIFENIQYTTQKFCDKIRAVSDTAAYYKGVIEGETFQRSFALCRGELLRIYKCLKPDRFEVSLIVGTDDPASTGEILAVLGILYLIFGPQVNVAGDFERRRLEGRVFIKGKLRLFTFVRTAVRIYFNRDIRKLYGLLKKEAV